MNKKLIISLIVAQIIAIMVAWAVYLVVKDTTNQIDTQRTLNTKCEATPLWYRPSAYGYARQIYDCGDVNPNE